MSVRILASGLTLCLWATACGPSQQPQQRWESDLYYTHKLHIDGQHALAAKRYTTLRKRAPTPDNADEAALVACEAERWAKRLRQAAACYDELAKSGHARPVRARALLHAGEIRYDDLKSPADGLKIFRALVQRAHDTSAALRALSHLVREAGKSEPRRKAELRWLLAAQKKQPKTELADNLLLRAAELLARSEKEPDRRQAVALLARMAKEHPTSSAGLVGHELRARLHRALCEPGKEALILERIVGTIETSHVVASYVEPAHTRSLERLVNLYAGPPRGSPPSACKVGPHKLDLAEKRLRRLLATAHAPRKYFVWLARLAIIQEKQGDKPGAMATWRKLVADVEKRQNDMKANDQRICEEEPDLTKRRSCLAKIAGNSVLPVKEAGMARAAIARLRASSRPPRRRR